LPGARYPHFPLNASSAADPEEQEVRRIGSNEVVKVDVRIIAASNRNLADYIEDGKFRQDLYLPPARHGD